MIQYIIENPVSTFFSIFAGVIATLLGEFLLILLRRLKESRSDYSGWWKEQIYDIDDSMCTREPVKVDYYKLRHSKLKDTGSLVINVRGKVWRSQPQDNENKDKSWTVCGYFDGTILTMLYKPKGGQARRGCIYLKKTNEKDYEFRGFYLSEHEDKGVIEKTPLKITKVKDLNEIAKLKKLYKG